MGTIFKYRYPYDYYIITCNILFFDGIFGIFYLHDFHGPINKHLKFTHKKKMYTSKIICTLILCTNREEESRISRSQY